MAETCPKCGYAEVEADECPRCRVIISKYQARAHAASESAPTQPPEGASAAVRGRAGDHQRKRHVSVAVLRTLFRWWKEHPWLILWLSPLIMIIMFYPLVFLPSTLLASIHLDHKLVASLILAPIFCFFALVCVGSFILGIAGGVPQTGVAGRRRIVKGLALAGLFLLAPNGNIGE